MKGRDGSQCNLGGTSEGINIGLLQHDISSGQSAHADNAWPSSRNPALGTRKYDVGNARQEAI